MDKICDKNKCSGCSACYNVCRHSAIEWWQMLVVIFIRESMKQNV